MPKKSLFDVKVTNLPLSLSVSFCLSLSLSLYNYGIKKMAKKLVNLRCCKLT